MRFQPAQSVARVRLRQPTLVCLHARRRTTCTRAATWFRQSQCRDSVGLYPGRCRCPSRRCHPSCIRASSRVPTWRPAGRERPSCCPTSLPSLPASRPPTPQDALTLRRRQSQIRSPDRRRDSACCVSSSSS